MGDFFVVGVVELILQVAEIGHDHVRCFGKMFLVVLRNDFHQFVLRSTTDLSIVVNAKAEEEKEALFDRIATPHIL